MDKGNPGVHRLGGIGKLNRLAIEVNCPSIGRQHSPENIHQGGLASTVLANQGADLTIIDGNGNILQDLVAPE